MTPIDDTELREQILSEFDLEDKQREQSADRIIALVHQREQAAELRGMEKAKSRVLRRTEIPADAKNPTRDATVYLGEEIADIIQRDMDTLRATKPEKGGLDGKRIHDKASYRHRMARAVQHHNK